MHKKIHFHWNTTLADGLSLAAMSQHQHCLGSMEAQGIPPLYSTSLSFFEGCSTSLSCKDSCCMWRRPCNALCPFYPAIVLFWEHFMHPYSVSHMPSTSSNMIAFVRCWIKYEGTILLFHALEMYPEVKGKFVAAK